MQGRINSYHTMGGADGPGIRFLVFMQGCPLRCVYCHNPETWKVSGGTEISSDDLFNNIKRYKPYFQNGGGVTVTGGEPLIQAKFIKELFKKCKENGINTALDTSGIIFNNDVSELLNVTDLVLLDIKFTDEKAFGKYTGGDLHNVLIFLNILEERKISVWIRQVIVPGLNDTGEDIKALFEILRHKDCVKRVQLLPFHKMCEDKYKSMNIIFPLHDVPPAEKGKVKLLQDQINNLLFDL
ncbi:MAG: pyruvate formate-lyase-activating protein [Bacillota bacterium]|nr:pyruvate formate-lyase-activating protein [Bacillota bacterium]